MWNISKHIQLILVLLYQETIFSHFPFYGLEGKLNLVMSRSDLALAAYISFITLIIGITISIEVFWNNALFVLAGYTSLLPGEGRNFLLEIFWVADVCKRLPAHARGVIGVTPTPIGIATVKCINCKQNVT